MTGRKGPGVKFKDAELIGIPVRVTVGKKLDEGSVEIFTRADKIMEVIPAERCLKKQSGCLKITLTNKRTVRMKLPGVSAQWVGPLASTSGTGKRINQI